MRSRLAVFALGPMAALGLWAGAAAAHVTVSPASLPQGSSDAILTFRVPNESATADVVGLRIQFPLAHPIVVLNPEAGSGWNVVVHSTVLPKPITTDDGTFTVDRLGDRLERRVDPRRPVRRVQRAGPGPADGHRPAHVQSGPALQRRHQRQLDPGSHQGRTGPGASRARRWCSPHPARVPRAPLRPAAQRRLRWPGRRSAQGSGLDQGLAIAALILAAFAVAVAVLAVWLGRPRLGVRESAAEDDHTT